MNKVFTLFLVPALMISLLSCQSIQNAALGSVADMLSSPDGSSAFTSDDDPALVGAALPLALKLYEIILDKDPDNAELAAATGKNFVMYAGAFVQMPSEMLDDQYWKEADEGRKRSKKLFLRGRNYLLQALELRHEGFRNYLDNGFYNEAISLLTEEDADAAYWAGLAWLGMASTDPLDMDLGSNLDKAALLLFRAMELVESNSGIHDVMIQVNLTLPGSILVNMRNRSTLVSDYMDRYYAAVGVGADPSVRAAYHYGRAIYLSDGGLPSPHITMATAVSVKKQDVEGFRAYLGKALAIDPEKDPDNRLMVLIYQDRAQWLLDNIELYFLVDF